MESPAHFKAFLEEDKIQPLSIIPFNDFIKETENGFLLHWSLYCEKILFRKATTTTTTKKQKHSQFLFCVLTVSAEAAIRKFFYDVVWHKRAGVTKWKMRCLHSSGHRLTKDSHIDIGRDVSTFHYIIHVQFIRRLREPQIS